MPPIRLGIKKIVRKMLVPLSALRVSACAMANAITLMSTVDRKANATVKKNDVENCGSVSART